MMTLPGGPEAILIVEDDERTAELERRTLERSGRAVKVVSRRDEAVNLLSSEPFRMVVLDYRMKGGDAWRILSAAQSASPRVPVVAVTAMGDEWLAADAIHRGAADYVVKTGSFWEQLPSVINRVTKLADAEQENARLASIVEFSDDAIIGAGPDGTITSWNAGAERIYGYPASEMVGRSMGCLLPPDLSQEMEKGLETLRLGKYVKHLETVRLRMDGTLTHVSETLSAIKNSTGEVVGVSAVVRDITERKLAEKRLAAEHGVTRILMESATVPEAAPKILRAICECLGWQLGILWRVDRDAEVLRCVEVWHQPSANLSEFAEASRLHAFPRRGSLPGEVWANAKPAWLPDFAGSSEALRSPMAARAGLHTAFAFPIGINEDISGVFEFLSGEIRQPDGEVLKMIASVASQVGQYIMRRDTERRKTKLEDQLRQAQKMEAVGRLAGGIAHDFNNLLTVINGYSQLVLFKLDERDPLRKKVIEVIRAGERATGLIRQLLAFSRKQVLDPKVLDLNAVVRDIESLLRRLIGEDIDLVTALGQDIGRVKADLGQIEQVIVNLAANARDAMPTGGRLTIETRDFELDEGSGSAREEFKPGRYVMLAVSDTGSGMDIDTRSHLFEPFFTTKGIGKGTGLGLSTVYGIVKQSGGFIYVYSEPGHGATFKVYLPRVDAHVEDLGPKQVKTRSQKGSETVLVAEDEEAIRTLVCDILRQNGYRVLQARDGREALNTCEGHNGPIDLMVTDVVMPVMGARELVTKVNSLHPETRVLCISGYTDDAIVRDGRLAPGTAYLAKPFTPNALLAKVREVIDTHQEGINSRSNR